MDSEQFNVQSEDLESTFNEESSSSTENSSHSSSESNTSEDSSSENSVTSDSDSDSESSSSSDISTTQPLILLEEIFVPPVESKSSSSSDISTTQEEIFVPPVVGSKRPRDENQIARKRVKKTVVDKEEKEREKMEKQERIRLEKERKKQLNLEARKRRSEDLKKSKEIKAMERKEKLKLIKQEKKLEKERQIQLEKETKAKEKLEMQQKKEEEKKKRKESLLMSKEQKKLDKEKENQTKKEIKKFAILENRKKKREEKENKKMEERNLKKQERIEVRNKKREEEAVKKSQEQDEKRQQTQEEKARIKEELKKTVEDLEIDNSEALPSLESIPDIKVTEDAFADLLMVVEFIKQFGETLGFDPENLPTVNSLQMAVQSNEEDLISIINYLLICATQDYKSYIAISTISDVLKNYIHRTEENNAINEWFSERSFLNFDSTQKARILAFICDQLLCSDVIRSQIDTAFESVAEFKKNKDRKSLFNANQQIRATCFGQDRYKRRFYYLPSAGGVLTEMKYDDNDVPTEIQNGWSRISNSSQVKPIMNALNQRGIREKELHNKLKKYQDFVCEVCDMEISEPKLTIKESLEFAPCRISLQEMEGHEDGVYFLQPVDTVLNPFYCDVIKNLMDFSTIKQKLADRDYETQEEFCDDVRLIFDNCETFNEDDSPVGKAGHNMRNVFEKRWDELKYVNKEV